MKIRQIRKKTGILLLSGIVAWAGAGCGSEMPAAAENGSTEYDIQTEMIMEAQAEDEVTLPEHFESMLFPMEAVMVEEYSQGLPYYKQDGNPDSFWFSMAVFSSFLAEQEDISPEFDGEYYYYSKEELDQMASVLYGDYAEGKMELADFTEDSPYVIYKEEEDKYGLLYGNVGNLAIDISSCQAQKEDYLVDAEILNVETGKRLAGYQMKLRPLEAAHKGSMFSYAIYQMTPLEDNMKGIEESMVSVSVQEKELEQPYGQDNVAEIAVDSDTNPPENEEEDLRISRKEALGLVQSYMAEDVTYRFNQMVSIGNNDYYDFAVTGDSLSYTDVFVSVNGMEIFGGNRNSDGSWSFDQ